MKSHARRVIIYPVYLYAYGKCACIAGKEYELRRNREYGNDRPKSPSFANGLALFSVFLVLSLILFGVFGKSGAFVTDFLTGVFGYAVYAYSVSGLIIGIALMLKRKRSVTTGVMLLYIVAVALVIVMIHMFSSKNYSGGTYGEYLTACYKNADTAGGWLGALLLYFPTKLYIVSEVLAGLLLVGVIALLIVCQLNKEITFRARQFGSGKTKKEKVRPVEGNSYQTSAQGYEEFYGDEDGREAYNSNAAKDFNKKVSRRFTRKPVEYDDVEDMGSESVEDYSDSYRYEENDAISDKVVDEALDVYNMRRKKDAMEKLYNKRDDKKTAASDQKTETRSSWDILYGGEKKSSYYQSSAGSYGTKQENTYSQNVRPVQPAKPEEEKDIYEGYSNNSRIRTMEENLRRMREEREREESDSAFDVSEEDASEENGLTESGYPDDGVQTYEAPAAKSGSSEDDMTRDLFTNIDKLLDDDKKDKKQSDKPLLSGSMDDFGEAEDKTERGGDPLKGFTGTGDDYKRSNATDYTKSESRKPYEASAQKNASDAFEAPKSFETSKPSAPVRPAFEPVRPAFEMEVKSTPASAPAESPKPKKLVKRKPYVPPRLDCLRDYKEEVDSGTDFEDKIASVETCLANFGIDAKVVNVVKGPTFSRLELEVPPGISVNKIPQHYNDLAMCLAAESIRIEAPIPKKRFVGIEIPNENRGTVGLKPIINSREFNNGKSSGLFFALGKDIDGECYVGDITEFPHALVAGASGAGKSVCLNCMLVSMLYKYSPEDLRLILIDPKEVEFNKYEGLPHLLVPEILSDNAKIINALKWAIDEMERRYSEIKLHKLSNIEEYNSACKGNKEMQKMPYILIIIDEAADIMQSPSAKEFEALVKRLTAKARAAGLHIIVATQRPSVDVITGTIKANLPTRIAFAVVSNVDSKTILDYAGAEKLLRKGDMLYKLSTKPQPVRLQCSFISGGEVLAVVDQVKENNEAYFDEDIQKAIDFVPEEPDQASVSGGDADAGGSGTNDPMFAQAVKLAIDNGSISISMLQRKLYLGFPRAAKLLDMMEARGFISKPAPGNKQRDILITQDEYDRLFSDEGGDGE